MPDLGFESNMGVKFRTESLHGASNDDNYLWDHKTVSKSLVLDDKIKLPCWGPCI